MAALGGFFGSGGKESRTTTTNTTISQEAGFSEISGQALSVQGEGNQISLSDFGAINAGLEIARESLRQVELAGSNTANTVGQAVQAVSESARAETENIVIQGAKWAALAVMVFAAAWALKGFAGK